MHDGIPFTLSIGANILQLLLDGYVALAGGGITSISDSCARRTV
jgi:hypothetical protein